MFEMQIKQVTQPVLQKGESLSPNLVEYFVIEAETEKEAFEHLFYKYIDPFRNCENIDFKICDKKISKKFYHWYVSDLPNQESKS